VTVLRVKPSDRLHRSWPERYKRSLRGSARTEKIDELEVRWDGEREYMWYAWDEIEELDES
jgi:hypothetical protein